VGSVIPVAVNPVRPSQPLQRHTEHCDDIPDVVGVNKDKTHATTATVPRTGPPLTAPSSRATDGGRTTNHYAATLEAAPV
jgi:hypothetical protein